MAPRNNPGVSEEREAAGMVVNGTGVQPGAVDHPATDPVVAPQAAASGTAAPAAAARSGRDTAGSTATPAAGQPAATIAPRRAQYMLAPRQQMGVETFSAD